MAGRVGNAARRVVIAQLNSRSCCRMVVHSVVELYEQSGISTEAARVGGARHGDLARGYAVLPRLDTFAVVPVCREVQLCADQRHVVNTRIRGRTDVDVVHP